jgi:hypothetical protein
MRYFEIDGKPCRALPFDYYIFSHNKDKLNDQSVFVDLPFNIMHEDLHNIFSDCGKIRSLKVSLD